MVARCLHYDMGTNSACNVSRRRNTKDKKVPRCKAGKGSSHEVPSIPGTPRVPAGGQGPKPSLVLHEDPLNHEAQSTNNEQMLKAGIEMVVCMGAGGVAC